MDIISGLNPQQRQAVEHARGPALVLAGAGSGKTRVIACRIVHLIQNSATRPENILAVTFTNKAAKEMRERVQKLIDVSRNAEPLISTFHSFCVRLLRREIQHLGYKRDFSIYDTDDQKRLIKQTLEEMKLSDQDLKPRDVISRISYAKNHGVAPENFAARFPSEVAKDIEYIYKKYDSRLRGSNSLDFDDLLLKSVAVLNTNPELGKYYSDWFKYILVDEYQDTNRPQYELLRLLTTTHNNLFVVGDEDQSIYKFRGADIQNILRFEKDFPGARVIRLEQNYRSNGNILKAAAAIVANNTERKGKTLWTQNPDGEKISCRVSQSSHHEAQMIAEHIRNILNDNPDENIAILYRANFISRIFEDVLSRQKIPYAVVGSVAFFGRAEIKDMIAYLRVIFNPDDDAALLRIINTPTRGIGESTVDTLTSVALEKGISVLETIRGTVRDRDQKLATRTLNALQRFLELVDNWTERQNSLSLAELLTMILTDTRYKEILQKNEMSEVAATRIANIDELIQASAESEKCGETIAEFLDRAALSSELDNLDPRARVSLMTIHSAKGLEFDTVFLVGMEEGVFPHLRVSQSKADLEEERRLCYVGITRARKKLFVAWTLFRRVYGHDAGIPAKISRFLQEIPEGLLEGQNETETGHDDKISFRRIGGTAFSETVQPQTIAELKTYLALKQKSAEPLQPHPAKKEISDSTGLRPGKRVRHEQFGDGIVLKRERDGNDYKLTVTFSRVGKKTLKEQYAKLKVL